MIKIQIQLPSEAEEIIKNQGYDVESYVDIMLVKPLLEQIKNKKVAEVVANADSDINVLIKSTKDKVNVSKQKFKNFEITDKQGVTTLELEVDDLDTPLMKFPKNTKVKKLE